MDRRAFLAALTPLAAGCFGGQPSEPTPTATETSTATETPEPTATETPEPTATPTPEASPEAAQHIDDAQDRLTEAVYIYTGGVTDDLLSVTAETESFKARDVLLRLDRVQRSVAAAEAAASTDDQRSTVDALDTMQRFLTHATDAQSWLIDGHDALTEAYARLDETELDAAADDLERVETAMDEVSAPVTTIGDELDPESASVTDAIGTDEYEQKVTQLRAERDALTVFGDAAADLHDGISLITDARDAVDDDRTDEAANTADQAYELLRDVEDELDEQMDDLSSDANAFEDVGDNLLTLASSRANEAESIYDQYA
ncbi:hypothetical protein [Haloplanus sp. C73]|uniref:hypothetical protein n=1 Tax=Haloplanus sp. C73 TaxID=3421641 RepID=UPI003EBC1B81